MTVNEKRELRERYKRWMHQAIEDGLRPLEADRMWKKMRAQEEARASQPTTEACFLGKEVG